MADVFGDMIRGIFGGGGQSNPDRLPATDPNNWFPGLPRDSGIPAAVVQAIGTDRNGTGPTMAQTNAANIYNVVRAAAGLPVIEITAPGAQAVRDMIEESGIGEPGTAPGAAALGGVGDALSDMVGRGAIIVLGLIFVAVGLAMFKPGMVVQAAQGLGAGVDAATGEA